MRGKVSAAAMLLAASLCAAALVGCAGGTDGTAGGADEEVEATLKDVRAFTDEIVKRVESAADPSAGVDDAQQYLDAKRIEVRAKIDSLRKIKNEQLSEATRGRKMESLTDDLMSVNGLQIKFMTKAMNDSSFKAKLDKLLSDYRALVDL